MMAYTVLAAGLFQLPKNQQELVITRSVLAFNGIRKSALYQQMCAIRQSGVVIAFGAGAAGAAWGVGSA